MTRKALIGAFRAAALAGAFFLAGGAIPVLGGVAMLFAPAPILIFTVGRPAVIWRTLISIGLAAGLVAVLTGPVAGISYLVTFGLATAVMCYLLERQFPFEAIVAITGIVMLLASGLAALAVTESPAALVKAVHDQLAAGMTRGQELYKLAGLQGAVPADTQASILSVTLRVMPALAAILAAVSVLANLRVFWRWVGKQRLSYLLFNDLNRWSAPEWLIWALIATGFGMVIPLAPVRDVALDLFLCVAAVYFCQGLAIMGFYFQMLAVPSAVRALIYFVTIVQPVVAAIVCVAGIFDMWIDFRRLKPPSQAAGNFGDFL
ncbi:MAG TPA: DUF2232 domain-containing protein [Candidatus Binataceae bacterium]